MERSLCKLAVFAALLLGSSIAAAAVADPEGFGASLTAAAIGPRAEADASPARIEESHPSIYYLPDKQGVLQPVLQFQYQDFVELYNLKHQLDRSARPPSFNLQRMTASGRVTRSAWAEGAADLADLTIRCQAETRDEGWVRIPLRLGEGLMQKNAEFKGEGTQFVQFEGKEAGYAWWIHGKPDAQYEIALPMLVPLIRTGEETRMKLTAPSATVSELTLQTPIDGAVGNVLEGATLASSSAGERSGTEFRIVGLGENFQFAWHKPGFQTAEVPVVLEATCTSLIRMDGHAITADAVLSVRSLGAGFERFSVLLPPDAEWIPENPSGYRVTPLESQNQPADSRRLVEVQFPQKTAGPVEIRLSSRRDYNPIKSTAWCELAGLEVVGAVRQSGTVSVETGEEWQVLWGPSRGVRPVDRNADPIRRESTAAVFEFDSESFSLPAKLVPRKTHVSVDPKYVLYVERDQIRLEGKLTCTVRGIGATSLEAALPGWHFDEAGPDSLVAIDGLSFVDDVLTIPLLQPVSGPMELQLRAHRAVEAGANSIAVPLPEPKNCTVGPATLVVLPADNVVLAPDRQACVGLSSRTGMPPVKLPMRQQAPLYYQSGIGPAVFAAGMQVFDQQIDVETDTHVTLNGQRADVAQKLFYAIAYEPAGRFSIAMPRTIAAGAGLRILLDGKPLIPVPEAELDQFSDSTAPILMHVDLPEPCIGRCELTLEYSIPVVEPKPDQSTAFTLPLPMPENVRIASHRASIESDRMIRAVANDNRWTVVNREIIADIGRSVVHLSAPRQLDRIDLTLQREGDDAEESLMIDRAWIQTRLTADARRDRAAFRLATDRKELIVRLPSGALADEVLVDGHRVESRLFDNDRISIPLSEHGGFQRRTVELRYRFPSGARPPRGEMTLDFPRFGRNVWVQHCYWQLVLPANEHLIANPSGLTSEQSWGWRGLFWGREPAVDSSQLERWVGIEPRAPLPEWTNVYLFSAFGDINRAEVRTWGRTWIVLWASGFVLVAGLLTIYVPACRHPAWGFAACVALSVAGLLAPDPTMLFAQGAILGLALSFLAGFLKRGFGRRRLAAPRTSPSIISGDVASTHSLRHPPIVGGQPSSGSAPGLSPEAPLRGEP